MESDWKKIVSEKDLAMVQSAMDSQREMLLVRSLGDLTVTIKTVKATPVWKCSMLVRLEQKRRNVFSGQYFSSLKELMEQYGRLS